MGSFTILALGDVSYFPIIFDIPFEMAAVAFFAEEMVVSAAVFAISADFSLIPDPSIATAMGSEKMSAKDYAYYTKVLARINKKLADV